MSGCHTSEQFSLDYAIRHLIALFILGVGVPQGNSDQLSEALCFIPTRNLVSGLPWWSSG